MLTCVSYFFVMEPTPLDEIWRYDVPALPCIDCLTDFHAIKDDNAFHWAGRQNHGAVLLAMSLELETTDPSTLNDCWLARVC